MRKIKFRIWNKQTKKMYSWGEFRMKLNENWSFIIDGQSISNYNTKLMQYTGLQDKNGKEYCRDDILVDSRNGNRYKVTQSAGAFWATPIDRNQMCESYCLNLLCHVHVTSEIIGNIHENSELLKGQ